MRTLPVIDPQMKPILDRGRANPTPDYQHLEIGEARRIFEGFAAYWNTDPVPMHAVEDVAIPAPHGAIAARLYIPTPAASTGPVLIYFHGGGWTFGSIASHDRAVRKLAQASGMRALSVDYRLAPEHPFPAAHEDGLAAIRFVENGGLGALVAPGQIALAGDSAGANLALGLLLARVRQGQARLGTAALLYGCFAPDHDTPSHARYGDGNWFLGTERMKWFWSNFLGPDSFETTSLAAPSRAPADELAQLPPLYLNAAGLDPLLDDTMTLAGRLAEAGTPFRLDVIPGVVHGFMQMSSELPAAHQAQVKVGEWLRSQLA
jgi:acetyl esterase